MSSTMRVVLAVVLSLSAGTILVLGAMQLAERRQTTNEVNRLREELYRARVESDRCRGSLTTSESSLRTLSATIDSLRDAVASYETLGEGRVPSERYDEYLGVFEAYNDSVAVWETRSERLRTAEGSCRSAIERHNALSDSIQTFLRAAGVDTG